MRIMDVKPAAFVAQLRCDRCGVEAQHNVGDGFNNFVQIGFDAAWGSELGMAIASTLIFVTAALRRPLDLGCEYRTLHGPINAQEKLPMTHDRPVTRIAWGG